MVCVYGVCVCSGYVLVYRQEAVSNGSGWTWGNVRLTNAFVEATTASTCALASASSASVVGGEKETVEEEDGGEEEEEEGEEEGESPALHSERPPADWGRRRGSMVGPQ